MKITKSRLPNIEEGGGGTRMHCPHCQEITECRVIPIKHIAEESGQRLYYTEHNDINWFRRARQCMNCSDGFLTAEVDEKFLDELIELRNVLGEIKLHSEDYLSESVAAAKSLRKLSSSLKLLKALNIYQNT